MNSFWENIKQAFAAIRMNRLRAVLTIFIIGFGIMALISMLTAVDGMKLALYSNFASVGSNTFTIKYEDELSGMQRRGWRKKASEPITYKQALAFQQRYTFPAKVSLSFDATGGVTVQFLSTKTAPKIEVTGVDHMHLATSGLQLAEGRNFTELEVRGGRKIAMIGSGLKEDIFGPVDAVGRSVLINSQKYTVTGVLQKKGNSFGSSQDDMVLIPVVAAQNQFDVPDRSYNIAVQVNQVERLDEAISEATGLFSIIRGTKIGEDLDFYVSKSDSLAQTLTENISFLKVIAFVIGLITLAGAAVGLTNIMLVSVTERTREIGLRKAVGATTKNIRNQFLLEALVICQTGGVFGIAIGLILGNLFAKYFEGEFLIPWDWIIFSFILCLIVGVIAGLYPANKAAKLDPVESLRHE